MSDPATRDLQLPLAGKLAVVTGASRGIGEGVAYELARRGASVRSTLPFPPMLTGLSSRRTDWVVMIYTGRPSIRFAQQRDENRGTRATNQLPASQAPSPSHPRRSEQPGWSQGAGLRSAQVEG
jgi:hypothetical protein